MDRKSIVGIALAIIVFVWAQYMARKEQALAPKPPVNTEAAVSAPSAAPAKETPAPAVAPAQVAAPQPAAVPEETRTLTTSAVEYTFTNLGGGIRTFKLLKHQGKEPGQLMTLNAEASHPVGALLLKPGSGENDAYQVTVEGDRVVCTRTVPPGVEIRKIYTPEREKGGEYRVTLEVAFTNRSAAAIEHPAYYLYSGATAPVHAQDLPIYIGFDWFDGQANSFITPRWFAAGKIPLVGVETAPAKPSYAQSPGNVRWAGVRDQYFTLLLLPQGENAAGVWARPLHLTLDSREVEGIEGALELSGFKLNPGETASRKLTIYAGPAEQKQLAALGNGASQMMNLDRWWITRTVGSLLLRAMNALEGLFHSYAVAIIVLTFIVRGALWPIQGKANQSMKKMQLLQPKMTELREKYKDDPARMNQEMMKLYKDYGANPLSGCVPMLIQIPIFFGFYSMLGTAVELRNSSFLWVHDLSRPDTIFHIGGIPVNILPLAMAATMIWQMQLTPKAGDPAQQKMMMFMPLVFVFITYNFASALALYYTVQNILSIIQLYATRNQPMPKLERAAAGARKRR